MPAGARQQVFLFLSLFFFQAAVAAPVSSSDHDRILEALDWMHSTPASASAQYDYVMTARVRLLLFWVGKDDVGEGYIRHGLAHDDPKLEFIQVLFGSDPARAPRAINRWGAGTEVQWHSEAPASLAAAATSPVSSSAFFGFMKSSKGQSVNEMQDELKKEGQNGEHLFTGIVSYVSSGRALSSVAPLASSTDFNLHQYQTAEPVVYDKLKQADRPIKFLDASSCPRNAQFLGTLSELIAAALNGVSKRSLCYAYDSKLEVLTLQHAARVKSAAVKVKSTAGQVLIERNYGNLLEAEFESSEPATGKKTDFTLLLGTDGAQRGVPIQVRYQPNWWFQVVLNLK
ncbi:MAG TPA: hypothetical protein VMT51_15005 [Dongiaceae bacterium]|nr:hypothetical protein [Dongiaceae bacterium]